MQIRALTLSIVGLVGVVLGAGCNGPAPTSGQDNADASANLKAVSQAPSAAARAAVARMTDIQQTARRRDPAQPRVGRPVASAKAISVLPPSVASRIDREGSTLRAHIAPERLALAVNPADATFGLTADLPFEVRDLTSAVAISVSVRGASPVAAEVSEGYVVYRGAHQGFDVVQRPTSEGTEDYIYFDHQPAATEVIYEVALGNKVAGLRLVENTLEVLDAGGAPRLRVASPRLVGSDGISVPARLTVENCAVDTSPAAPWDRPVTAPGARSCTVHVNWSGLLVSYPAVLDPSWTATGSMLGISLDSNPGRASFTLTVLQNGKALAAGGGDLYRDEEGENSAELYDPNSGTWALTANMVSPRTEHTANLLANGKVLVVGGMDQWIDVNGRDVTDTTVTTKDQYGKNTSLRTCETYDPASGTWTAGPQLIEGRASHKSVTLPSGDVLVTGGYQDYDKFYLNTGEIYSVANNTWTATPNMLHGREGHYMVLLKNNKVMVGAGYNDKDGYLLSTEYLDPAAPNAGWIAGPDMLPAENNFPRWAPTSTLLPDGTLLIVAGYNDDGTGANSRYLNSAEVFDPIAGTWSNTANKLANQRYAHVATLLPCGTSVLITGGYSGTNYLSGVEIYDIKSKTFSSTTPMAQMRAGHGAAVVTANGAQKVLVAGGSAAGDKSINLCEVFSGFGALGCACTAPADCISNFCADGVCCNQSCTGSCDSCNVAGSIGTCTIVMKGQPGSPACAPYVCDGSSASCPMVCASDMNCAAGSVCSCAKLCVAPQPNGACCTAATQCASGFCSDGVCCNTACSGSCDVCSKALGATADGTCTIVSAGNAGNPSCAPFFCDGVNATCPTSCKGDSDCGAGKICDCGGKCVVAQATGACCTRASQCANGQCVDGFCCSTACNGSCDVCSVALGATANGTCTVVAKGQPGSPACAPYLCNGASASCPPSCTLDADCANGNICNCNGLCVPPQANGFCCTRGGQCNSTFCSDGFCCNAACGGSCDVCSASLGATANGTCTIVTKGQPGSPACAPFNCDGTSATCPGRCATDGDCATGSICNCGGMCVAPQSLGSCCTRAAQCGSGFCSDGVCCNAACSGSCDACTKVLGASADGICTVLVKGATGNPSCGPAVCNGVSPNCPSSCTLDSDCAGGNVCNCAGQCVAPQANGACCSRSAQCSSTFCSDGFCCNAACTGSCDVCAASLGATANGTCTLVAKGQTGSPSCSPFVCSGTVPTCPNTCTVDADCINGDICNCAGQCVAPQANGLCCSRAGQCSSGFCSDGVCCNAACGGSCDACSKAAGASADGVCTILSAGNVGNPVCPIACDGTNSTCPPTCTTDASCGGAAGSRYCDCNKQCHATGSGPLGSCCTAATNCASGFCSDGVCCNAACGGSCDVCSKSLGATADGLCTIVGKGQAGAPSCSPFLCDGATATCPTMCTTDRDCIGGDVCSCAGTCVAPQPLGSCCSRAAQCSSGFCSDGVCCNALCGGSCDVCSKVLGALVDGTCTIVSKGATGSPSCAPVKCDGTSAQCPTTCTTDSDCGNGTVCNCASQCVPAQMLGACCTRGAQCASTFCSDGVCCNAACGSSCDACSKTLGASADGICTIVGKGTTGSPACQPYLCDGATASCPVSCTSDSDCIGGDICNCAGKCVAPQAPGACCTRSTQCANNQCVDGFCCNTPCAGNCDVCAKALGATVDGTCTVVAKGNAGMPGCAPFLCDGTSATCPGTCVSDTDCGAGAICNCGHRCVQPQPNGSCCTTATQCASNFCANGYCCNSACTDGCDRCDVVGKQGQCTVISKGSAGSPTCAPYLCDGAGQSCPMTCVADGDCAVGTICNCAGKCVAPQALGACCTRSTQCNSSICSDGVCCNTPCNGSCDVCSKALGAIVDGTCTIVAKGNPGAPSCAPYSCDGLSASCPGMCAADSDCGAGQVCNCANRCVAPQQNGACCTRGAQCNSGFCVDGLCCNSPCNSGCDKCNLTGKEGTCTVVSKGDPGANPSCMPFVCDGVVASCPSACRADSDCQVGDICNCKGQCVAPQVNGSCCMAGDQCTSGFCVDNVCCATACNGACDTCSLPGMEGKCLPSPAGSEGRPKCTPYVCDGTHDACPNTCAAMVGCDDSHVCCGMTCIQSVTAGDACTSDCGCVSGHCVDGVCCDTACTGTCQACNVKGSEGKCSNVTGTPVAPRAACTGGADGGVTPCTGTCDGTSPMCVFPMNTVKCAAATCSNNMAVPESFCDGTGNCKSGGPATTCPAGCIGTVCAMPDMTTPPPPDMTLAGGRLVGGGCSCDVGARQGKGAPLLLLAGLFALLFVRRRR